MILHTFPPAFGQRNPSPFCMKVEMALTHLGMDFSVRENMELTKSPKRKPWLEDQGRVIADSDLILHYLDNKSDGALFRHLTTQQQGIGVSFVRLTEHHLYWLILASRWLEDDWFANIERDFFGYLPKPLAWFVSRAARLKIRRFYQLHDGLGQHCREEQTHLLRADLNAIAAQVQKDQFITGGEMCVFDFSVAAVLACAMDSQPTTWVSEIVHEYAVLRDYAEKVQDTVGVYCRFKGATSH